MIDTIKSKLIFSIKFFVKIFEVLLVIEEILFFILFILLYAPNYTIDITKGGVFRVMVCSFDVM